MVFDLNDCTEIDVVRTYLQQVASRGQKIGLTSGSFDLFHSYHAHYLARCRRYCDVLVVGVDSDELVRERKGEGRPLTYDLRRVGTVDGFKPVTFAFILNSVEDFGRAAKICTPDFIFKNDAFRDREGEVLGREFAKEIRIIRDVADYTSTTQILKEAARIANLAKP